MDNLSQRKIQRPVCKPRSSISKLTHDAGVTLIELLAGLAIGTVILSVVVYTGRYEMNMWAKVTVDGNVRSDVRFVDQKFQDVFQNLTGVKIDTTFPTQTTLVNGSTVTVGTAVVGTDALGESVEVYLQQPTVLSSNTSGGQGNTLANSAGGVGAQVSTQLQRIVVTYTPSGGTSPSKSITFPTMNSSFAGTTFRLSGSLVVVNYHDTNFSSMTSPTVYQQIITYATEGGY